MNKLKTIVCAFALILSLTGIISCGGGESRKIKSFGEKFASFVNTNSRDSIETVFPAADFDGYVPLSTDSITVKDNGGGLYTINYSSTRKIEVAVEKDGRIVVKNSKGIAAFPKEKFDLAKATGMINDDTDDLYARKLLDDDNYFEWLRMTYLNNGRYKIKITPGKTKELWKDMWGEAFKGTVTVTLTNLTDTPISADDYSISYKARESNGYTDETQRSYTKSHTRKGISLGPRETGKITLTDWLTEKYFDFEIIPANGKEELLQFAFKPTGNEYNEYLKLLAASEGEGKDKYDWLSTREATHKDLSGKSSDELRIMRNWIYARHGYIFKSADLREYFSKFSWYHPTSSDVSHELSRLEKHNVSMIQDYE